MKKRRRAQARICKKNNHSKIQRDKARYLEKKRNHPRHGCWWLNSELILIYARRLQDSVLAEDKFGEELRTYIERQKRFLANKNLDRILSDDEISVLIGRSKSDIRRTRTKIRNNSLEYSERLGIEILPISGNGNGNGRPNKQAVFPETDLGIEIRIRKSGETGPLFQVIQLEQGEKA